MQSFEAQSCRGEAWAKDLPGDPAGAEDITLHDESFFDGGWAFMAQKMGFY